MLVNDFVFKYVFGDKNILIDFLNSYFAYIKTEIEVTKYEGIAEGSIRPATINGIECFGDLIGEINDSIIVDIEMYKDFGIREFYKTKAYMVKLFSNQYESIKNYKDAKKVLSINFITGNFKKQNKYPINNYVMKHKISNEEIFDEKIIEIALIRIDFEKTIGYNENERYFKYLKLIKIENLEEMESFVKGDEIMSKAAENLRKFLSKPENRRDRLQERYDDGVEDGIEKGVAQGIEQNQITVAKNLLELKLNTSDIAKATGLSEKRIKMLM